MRYKRHQINFLVGANGDVTEDEKEIMKEINTYFQNLFSSSQLSELAEVLEGIEPRISGDMNEALGRPFSGEEVLIALQQMHPSKAPGPDRVPAFFYQDNWPTVGPVVIDLVLGILNEWKSPADYNETLIVFIPKVRNPKTVKEFRPILLCNVVYKLVSKTLANRLKCILPGIISENQSAFTPGRLITDNIFVAFEILLEAQENRQGRLHGS